MKLLFSCLMLLNISACAEEKICWYETGECHTKSEWEEISKRNWESIACMEKAQTKLNKKLKGEALLDAMIKECKLKETVRVYN